MFCVSGRWWLEHVLFSHILGIVIPTDELIFFRGVAQPPTRCSWTPWNMILVCLFFSGSIQDDPSWFLISKFAVFQRSMKHCQHQRVKLFWFRESIEPFESKEMLSCAPFAPTAMGSSAVLSKTFWWNLHFCRSLLVKRTQSIWFFGWRPVVGQLNIPFMLARTWSNLHCVGDVLMDPQTSRYFWLSMAIAPNSPMISQPLVYDFL